MKNIYSDVKFENGRVKRYEVNGLLYAKGDELFSVSGGIDVNQFDETGKMPYYIQTNKVVIRNVTYKRGVPYATLVYLSVDLQETVALCKLYGMGFRKSKYQALKQSYIYVKSIKWRRIECSILRDQGKSKEYIKNWWWHYREALEVLRKRHKETMKIERSSTTQSINMIQRDTKRKNNLLMGERERAEKAKLHPVPHKTPGRKKGDRPNYTRSANKLYIDVLWESDVVLVDGVRTKFLIKAHKANNKDSVRNRLELNKEINGEWIKPEDTKFYYTTSVDMAGLFTKMNAMLVSLNAKPIEGTNNEK